jgi:response regulator of citrate/malate metabolism
MIRALIVEDDPMVAQINRRYLEEYPVIQVESILKNGEEALDYLQKNNVDLMIMDVYMPEISGLEVLRSLRRMGMRTDVIIVTAANDVQQIDEMLRLGVVDYLVKPFEYERFREAVERYLVRMGILNSGSTLNQEAIDRMVKIGDPYSELPVDTEKGVQSRTLRLVLEPLRECPGRYFSCEELAAMVGFSKVTIRRYLNYLLQTKRAECVINYETGGRPSMKYRYIGVEGDKSAD